MKRKIALLVLVSGFYAGATAGDPSFFLSPGPDESGDIAWQDAVGPFFEEDFESFQNAVPVPSLELGGVTINLSIPGAQLMNPEIFTGNFVGAQPGTMFNRSLLSVPDALPVVDNEVVFTFSVPVRGIGVWLYDDSSFFSNSIELQVNGEISPVLDANPGMPGQLIEGFIGVVDSEGMVKLTIRNIAGDLFFEMDHLQIALICLTTEDTDGDGINNASDNCLSKPNPDQIDTNGDGYGNRCDADLNGDGVVNVVDLGIMKTVFFTSDLDADLDSNGIVNVVDLGLLKEAFFGSPGLSCVASDSG